MSCEMNARLLSALLPHPNWAQSEKIREELADGLSSSSKTSFWTLEAARDVLIDARLGPSRSS